MSSSSGHDDTEACLSMGVVRGKTKRKEAGHLKKRFWKSPQCSYPISLERWAPSKLVNVDVDECLIKAEPK